jgi:F-type H+-transporting ATPase subunit alpha
LDCGNGVTGLALNLEERKWGGILNDYHHQEGQEVRTTGKLLQMPVGKIYLAVLGSLGNLSMGRACSE